MYVPLMGIGVGDNLVRSTAILAFTVAPTSSARSARLLSQRLAVSRITSSEVPAPRPAT
jgi:hypothetical protein